MCHPRKYAPLGSDRCKTCYFLLSKMQNFITHALPWECEYFSHLNFKTYKIAFYNLAQNKKLQYFHTNNAI